MASIMASINQSFSNAIRRDMALSLSRAHSHILIFLSVSYFSFSLSTLCLCFVKAVWQITLALMCERCRVTSELVSCIQMWICTPVVTNHVCHNISRVNTVPTARSRITWETTFQQMVCLCHLPKKMVSEAAIANTKKNICGYSRAR